MIIRIEPVAYVETPRTQVEDDFWGEHQACVALTESFTSEALLGLDEFSHVEILFLFHGVTESQAVTTTRRPRRNPEWPEVGIFSQRARKRPNRIGSTICRILRIEGTRLYVSELDAIDGSPVVDIKPVLAEFLPRGEVRQPGWSTELMQEYWQVRPRPTEER